MLPIGAPNTHLSNAVEQVIHTFKYHLISIISGVAPDFPRNLWYILIPDTEVTLNLLCQTTLEPSISAWAYFHGTFNYGATLIGSLGCNIIVHKNMGTRNSWDFCGTAGWNLGVALQHCQMVDTRLHLLHFHNIHQHCSRIFQYFDFEKWSFCRQYQGILNVLDEKYQSANEEGRGIRKEIL